MKITTYTCDRCGRTAESCGDSYYDKTPDHWITVTILEPVSRPKEEPQGDFSHTHLCPACAENAQHLLQLMRGTKGA